MTTLKPCPNPECSRSDIGKLLDSYPYLISCRICDLSGPSGESKDEAIRLWNNLPRQPKWLPMDTAPKDGTLILATGKWYHPTTLSWRTYHPNAKGKYTWRTGDGSKFESVTHWMPLPPKPTESSKETNDDIRFTRRV